jgi:hypothetical protein
MPYVGWCMQTVCIFFCVHVSRQVVAEGFPPRGPTLYGLTYTGTNLACACSQLVCTDILCTRHHTA